MALQKILVLVLLLCATRISSERGRSYFVVWNVGQGQWTTWMNEQQCLHFDMGGELDPSKKVSAHCRGKEQRLYISHLDWDHINFIGSYLFKNQFCKANYNSTAASSFKQKILSRLSFCAIESPKNVQQIYAGKIGKSTNESSQVHIVDKNFLIPGDSTSKEEKLWSNSSHFENIETLVLGHHGSKTSTSEFLLSRLPSLKQAISSARFLKYRHPHVSVQMRLRKNHIPLLRTEDWGHIFIEQKRTDF